MASVLEDRQLVIYEAGDASVTSIAHAVGMIKPGAVFIDYLQLLKSPYKARSREEEVAGISRALQRLAHQAQIPIVCAAQLRRPREGKDEKPGLYELRESGAIENDADIVMLVWHDKTHRQGFVDLRVSVEKARHGPTGVAMLKFDKDRQLITDGAKEV
jgi:replicative DNA helicase